MLLGRTFAELLERVLVEHAFDLAEELVVVGVPLSLELLLAGAVGVVDRFEVDRLGLEAQLFGHDREVVDAQAPRVVDEHVRTEADDGRDLLVAGQEESVNQAVAVTGGAGRLDGLVGLGDALLLSGDFVRVTAIRGDQLLQAGHQVALATLASFFLLLGDGLLDLFVGDRIESEAEGFDLGDVASVGHDCQGYRG